MSLRPSGALRTRRLNGRASLRRVDFRSSCRILSSRNHVAFSPRSRASLPLFSSACRFASRCLACSSLWSLLAFFTSLRFCSLLTDTAAAMTETKIGTTPASSSQIAVRIASTSCGFASRVACLRPTIRPVSHCQHLALYIASGSQCEWIKKGSFPLDHLPKLYPF